VASFPRPLPVLALLVLQFLTAAAFLVLIGGCRADRSEVRAQRRVQERPAAVRSAASCTIAEVARHHLRLADGHYVYVEPQHFARGAQGWVLAGQPTYRVRVDRDEGGALTESGGWFGVTFTVDEARPIALPPVPPGSRIVWARGAPARVAGRSGFVYEVADGAPGQRGVPLSPARPHVPSRLVFAEYDGVAGTWEPMGELPAPREGRLRGLEALAGPLDVTEPPDGVRRRGTAAQVLAVPHELPRGGVDVLLFRLGARGWTSSRVWPRWIDEIAIGAAPGRGAVLALAGLDSGMEARRASVRTLFLDPPHGPVDSMSARRLQNGEPGERFASPAFASAAGRLDLGWLRRTPGAPTSAWVMPGVREDRGRPRVASGGPYLIDPMAGLIVPVDGAHGASLWLTARAPGPGRGSSASIRATLLGPAGAVDAGLVPNPFHGPFAAVRASPTEVLVVGPEARFDPVRPYVRSLVIRLSIRCTP
jgi:hypothetical protein